jgi:protein gp37
MADSSAIEWTDATWNPVTGCTKISAGCDNCYAARFSERFRGVAGHPFFSGFDLTPRPERLEQPFRWRRPRRIFVNSMSDLFHKDVPVEFVLKVFDVMQRAHWHTFQVLTKRAERLEELSPQIDWPDNVWMGVSVENGDYTYRIDHLRRTEAQVKFLSLEPLLGPLHNLNLEGIHWAIVGGESGPGARPLEQAWVTEIRDQCLRAGVPFFFKQWGGTNKKKAGRVLEGRTWDEMPVNLSWGKV